MSFRIVSREELHPEVIRLIIEAPAIAAKAQAGQFVAVVADQTSERIPLTLADWDREKGTITLIFQKIGRSTRKLSVLGAGDAVAHILGPLGHATEIKSYGEVVCIGGGVGIAEVYPVTRALKQAGNRVICIIGARSAGLLMLEDELRAVSDEFFVTTDDGSSGKKGLVTDVLAELFTVVEQSTHTQYPGLVYAIGPVPMMRAVAEVTRGCGVKTVVSLNPIMVDATGMCGACRCSVGKETKFGCVDGPDFDAHLVDFDELEKRLTLFREQEREGETGSAEYETKRA
ncbi:MAG: sulfide/dihydroorotate dehydrogenase-like FAD/NAD-binding protein [Candidatus Omnitrophica bacterium]|nr:sulfide/dihydroorotate dehydrogenase-like FAD/NAD-binding protein [Candidatus Omnitrophota bacterium]